MKTYDRRRFGDALKAYRKKRSYKDLALETGVDALTLARFESGSRIRNTKAFLRLCQIMGKSPADFPEPEVNVPDFPTPLSHNQWQAMMRLYAYRFREYIRASSIGSSNTLTNLAQLGLLVDMNMNERRMPYVRISKAGIKYCELYARDYRGRYPDLYGMSNQSQSAYA